MDCKTPALIKVMLMDVEFVNIEMMLMIIY